MEKKKKTRHFYLGSMEVWYMRGKKWPFSLGFESTNSFEPKMQIWMTSEMGRWRRFNLERKQGKGDKGGEGAGVGKEPVKDQMLDKREASESSCARVK